MAVVKPKHKEQVRDILNLDNPDGKIPYQFFEKALGAKFVLCNNGQVGMLHRRFIKDSFSIDEAVRDTEELFQDFIKNVDIRNIKLVKQHIQRIVNKIIAKQFLNLTDIPEELDTLMKHVERAILLSPSLLYPQFQRLDESAKKLKKQLTTFFGFFKSSMEINASNVERIADATTSIIMGYADRDDGAAELVKNAFVAPFATP